MESHVFKSYSHSVKVVKTESLVHAQGQAQAQLIINQMSEALDKKEQKL